MTKLQFNISGEFYVAPLSEVWVFGAMGCTKYEIQIERISKETLGIGIEKNCIDIGCDPLSIGIVVLILVLQSLYTFH